MFTASAFRRVSLAAACLATLAATGLAQTIPPATAIPVEFPDAVIAGKAHPGDAVLARTTQAVILPGGRVLPAGATLTGHVVASTPFVFNPTPYAVQQPSILSVHFDAVKTPGGTIPVELALRAMAGPVASRQAATPYGLDEIDWSPVRTLIGGDTTSALQATVLSPAGDIVGYTRRQGVFAHLIAAPGANADSGVQCDAGATEQSVSIFSPSACGVYGFGAVALAANGSQGGGTFVLRSSRRSVAVAAGSSALLEEMPR